MPALLAYYFYDNRPWLVKLRNSFFTLKNKKAMYVIKKMRLNRFELRPCVSARALFASKGPQAATVTSKLGADCFDAPNVDGASKTKLLGMLDEMAATAYAMRKSDGQAEPMSNTNAVDR